jgi:hypothetical protein
MNNERRKLTALPLLHLFAMIAIGIWWGLYFWDHTPARDVFRLHRPTPTQVSRAGQRSALTPRFDYLQNSQAQRFLGAARAGAGDVLFGLGVLALLMLGTGIYVRRIDNWLRARTSGDAVALRGTDLASATVAANTQKSRGVLR